VSAHVTFTNRSGGALDEVLFLVDANTRPEIFILDAVRWGNGADVETWFLEGGFLTVRLPEPLPSGARVVIDLDYRLQLPYAPGKLGYYNRQLNLADWYPMTAVYRQGSGWLAYPLHDVGETLSYESADYHVRMEIMQAPETLVVAASLPAVQHEHVYVFEGAALRSFVISMSAAYELVQVNAGEVEVRSYFFPEHRDAGIAALRTAERAITVFTKLFGPYPHEAYSVVSGNFPDGLEYDGLTFTGLEYYDWFDGTEQNYLTLITVHEAAHQWFYGIVGNDQALEPWVDEALCIYSELLFIEEAAPELIEWWWAFRLDEFRPLSGEVNLPVFAYRGYRPYVNAVYLRGAEMVHAIRLEMGKEVFLESLRAYLAGFRHQQATGQDLLRSFEVFSGKSLDFIVESYFSNPQ